MAQSTNTSKTSTTPDVDPALDVSGATPSEVPGAAGFLTGKDTEDLSKRLGVAKTVDVVAVASVRTDGTADQTPGYEKIAGAVQRGGEVVETR
jgi:hypothetical protein